MLLGDYLKRESARNGGCMTQIPLHFKKHYLKGKKEFGKDVFGNCVAFTIIFSQILGKIKNNRLKPLETWGYRIMLNIRSGEKITNVHICVLSFHDERHNYLNYYPGSVLD